jgi:hypothetical protein
MSVSSKTYLLASFAAVVAAPCFLGVHDAHAQGPSGGPLTVYPACTIKPTPQDSEAAHSAFLLGKRFFEESDYGSASHNFIDAFKLDCTKPDLLLNIARANELLGNRPEAIHALETYLQRSPTLGPEERAQLQRRIDNLKAMLAQSSPPPVATTVVTPPVVETPAAAPPPPAPLPPPVEERHHTAVPWVVVGVGAAAAIAGGVLYGVGASDVSSAQNTCNKAGSNNCPNTPAGRSAQSQGQTGDTLETVGAVVFWSGIGIAAGGVLWHFLEPTGPKESKTGFTPMVGPGFGGAAAYGTF